MISIRPTVMRDVPILAEIQKQAFLPLYEKYHDAGNPHLRGVDDITCRLDSLRFRYFTVLEDGVIVGGVMYNICSGSKVFMSELKAGEYYLSRVYIKPQRQGRKIAQQAILLCEREFSDAKVFGVDFPQDLEKNRRCYEGVGFRDTGIRQEVQPGLVLAFFKKDAETH